MMSELDLIRPLWLALLPAGLGALWLARRHLASGERWRRVCDATLLVHLLEPGVGRDSRLPLVLAGVGLALASIALAGPTWRSVEQPVHRSREATVVVLDVSASMRARDVAPSRLERARLKVADLLRRIPEGQIGLVVFAGDGFIVAPLTDDARTLLNLLPALDPRVAPVQGSRAGLGLVRAGRLLERAEAISGRVFLVADGVHGPEAVGAARQLRAAGHRVSVLAVGTAEGAPVPVPEGGFLADGNGHIVLARVDLDSLREVARAGGGTFARLRADESDLDRLLGGTTASRLDRESELTGRAARIPRDDGVWLVLVLLPIVAAAFRRGWLLAAGFVVLIPLPRPADALEWSALWARPDQRTARALAEGRDRIAMALAPTPGWRGAAQYRTGDYVGAARTFAGRDDAVARYNRGTALARADRLVEALDALEGALALAPDMADARHNRDLVARLLRDRKGSGGEGGESGSDGSPAASGASGSQAGEGRSQRDRPPDSGEGSDAATGDGEKGSNRNEDGSDPRSEQAGEDADDRPDEGARGTPEPHDGQGRGGRMNVSDTGEVDLDAEEHEALQQWLRRIPDDPGGLLRRKFALDYRTRADRAAPTGRTW